ncbi:hypothetical protein CsSME_00029984 [Camellia sinensis var. sinensis]
MPLSRALRILTKKGHLKPLEPQPLPSHLPAGHDATQYCAYHQQTGHTTDNCFRVRPPAGGARFTPDVAFDTHYFEHLRMLNFVVSDLGVDSGQKCPLRSKSRRWIISQINEDRQECQIPKGRKEKSFAEGQPSSYPQH